MLIIELCCEGDNESEMVRDIPFGIRGLLNQE